LQMSGRVGKLSGVVASLLNVKPIVVLEDGLLEAIERVRTHAKSIDRMVELTAERVGQAPINLAVVHAEAPKEAHTLLERARSTFNCQEVFIDDLAISLAVQFGPGVLGLVSYKV